MRFAMSVLTTCTALLMGFRVAWGQGTVTFNNRNLAAGVDARVTFWMELEWEPASPPSSMEVPQAAALSS
jgi:hypothetical protein